MKPSAGPKVPSEKSPGGQEEDLSVAQRAGINPEPISLRPESNLPLKGDQNIIEPTSTESVEKEQQLPKKKILKSLRNFPYELTYYCWYRDDNNNIFKNIFIEFDIKDNLNRFVKLLFAVAKVIHYQDHDERYFLHIFNHIKMNILKIYQMGQNQHFNNLLTIYVEWLRKFGFVPLT